MQKLAWVFRFFVLLVASLAWPVITLRADEKTEPPVPVRTVAPEVPRSFAKGGVSGLVTVGFTVDEKGNVQDAKVIKSSHQELEESALVALKKWRFKPAKKDGVAVALHVVIPIKFDIE